MSEIAVTATSTRRCPSCGFLDSGTYCSSCGSELGGEQGQIRELASAFLSAGELKAYALTYLRILRRPTKQTLKLADELSRRQVARFLKLSVALYVFVMVAENPTFDLGALGNLALPTGIVAAYFVFYGGFYAVARLVSRQPIPFGAFAKVAALQLGFTLPPIALSYLRTVSPAIGVVAGIAALGVLVYTLRLWRRFWQVGWLRLLACLLGSYPGLVLAAGMALRYGAGAGGRRVRAAL
jgi:hypothetical protein